MSAGLAQSFRSHTVKKMQNPNNIWFWLRMLNSLCLVDKQQNICNQNCSSVIGIQPSIDVVLIWIFTATLCRIEAPCTFLSNDLWVLSRPQMLEDCWSSALWCLLCPFSSSPFGFVCPSFLSALFFGSLWCLTLHSHQSCCCLWIAVLLWSKADLAAVQQACLWVLAEMLADLNIPGLFIYFFW